MKPTQFCEIGWLEHIRSRGTPTFASYLAVLSQGLSLAQQVRLDGIAHPSRT
jgi:hypothetical protein